MSKKKHLHSNIVFRKNLLFIVIILFIALCSLFLLALNVEEKVYQFDYQSQPVIGNVDAPIKIVEFADFKCSSCKKFHKDIYPLLKRDYIDSGEISFYYVGLSFVSPDSKVANIVGESIYHQNNASFWSYYDLVFENLGENGQQWATPSYLLKLVKNGVKDIDLKQLELDIANKTYEKEVLEDENIANSVEVQSTPSLFINGVKVKDPFNYEKIQDTIKKIKDKK